MAYHGPSYGLDAELAAKMASKRDPKMEAEVIEWVAALIGRPINDLHEDLKDGQALCEYVRLHLARSHACSHARMHDQLPLCDVALCR